MSRQESDREDLLREATALVERVELRLSSQEESIVVGFRRDGAASFFFGQSPVYQFNSRRELRRAYIGGLLYKVDSGRLVEMRRERTAVAVELRSRGLPDDEAGKLLVAAEIWLRSLRDALAAGTADVLGQVPIEQDVAARVAAWLAELPAKIVLAKTSRL